MSNFQADGFERVLVGFGNSDAQRANSADGKSADFDGPLE